MITTELKEILVCPRCKSGLEYVEDGNLLECRGCSANYPLLDDIPCMLLGNVEGIIDKYNQGWDRQALNQFWNYEHNFVIPTIFDSPQRVLDLACGDGAVSDFLRSRGFSVFSLDISSTALNRLKSRGEGNINLVLGSTEEPLPFKDNSFDSVFWGDNIEHLFEPMNTLLEIRRVLKKEGRVVISFPNMACWRYRQFYLIYGYPASGEGLFYEPWERQHIRYFNHRIIKRMLKKADFEFTELYGVGRVIRADRIRKLEHRLAKYFPNIFGSILVVVGRKKNK